MTYPHYGGMPPHEKASTTSKLAAADILPYANTLRERVYRLVASRGNDGATVDEVEAELRMLHQTASARARELVQEGRLAPAGFTRRTRSGRKADVLIRAELAEPAPVQEVLF